MAAIRSLAKIVDKYKRVTPGKAKEYLEGVKDPKKKWVEEAAAAEDAWEEGVQGAIARGSFKTGIEAAGQETYLDAAIKKGEGRYRGGVEYGIPKYQKKFARYRDVIAGVMLPPRGAKGDPRNIDRVTAIASALHDEKIKG